MISQYAAKKLICPPRSAYCVASDCMMWRFGTEKQLISAAREALMLTAFKSHTKASDMPSNESLTDKLRNMQNPPEGYCGLAGVPSGSR